MLRKFFKSSNKESSVQFSPNKVKTPEERKAELFKRKVALVKSILLKYVIPLGISALVLLVLLPIVYFISTRLGFGRYFPAQKYFTEMKPLIHSNDLEVVAELPIPPGNIAVSSKGRIFFNFHPEYSPTTVKVAELSTKTNYKAFPNVEFQSKLITCLSMRIDRQDRLWLLDFGSHGMKASPVIYAFDLKHDKDELVKQYVFPNHVAGFGSMLNDFQVDPSGNFIYIADTSMIALTPALIVYSVVDDVSYRILSSHESMFGSSVFLSISNQVISYGPLGLKVNIDSIALDRTGSKLYYGAMSGNNLYSISTSHLLHYVRTTNKSSTSKSLLDQNIHSYITLVTSEKPVTDGMSVDGSGNIWMTCIEHSSIALAIPLKVKPKNGLPGFATQDQVFKIVKVIQDIKLLRWPDSVSFGPDGLYITNSALQLKFRGVTNYTLHSPFHILRLPTRRIRNDIILKDGSIIMPPAGH